MRSNYMILLNFLVFSLFSSQAAWAILPIQHWQTSNGARVYFVENRDIPMIDLSIDFAAGNARVDPKRYPQTCRYCEVKPFCRIYERLGNTLDEDAA